MENEEKIPTDTSVENKEELPQADKKLSKLNKTILRIRNVHLALLAAGLLSSLIGAGLTNFLNDEDAIAEALMQESSHTESEEDYSRLEQRYKQFVKNQRQERNKAEKFLIGGLAGIVGGLVGTTLLEKTQKQEDRWFENTF